MRVIATDNRSQGFAQMDRWADAVASVAIPRALNKLADQAETAGLRAINDIYKIGPRTFEKYVTVKVANASDLEAGIVVKGRGLPVYLFSPRAVRGKGGGVSVLVKGRRFLIPHAFVARMRSGRVGVFSRGSYKGSVVPTGKTFGRFTFGKTRLPINELFTFSAPGAFSNEKVTEAMNTRVAEQASKVLAAEFRFAAR